MSSFQLWNLEISREHVLKNGLDVNDDTLKQLIWSLAFLLKLVLG